MATLDELAEALIVAEQQGDAEAVSVLAQAYQEQKAAQAPVLQDTGQGRFTSGLSNVARGFTSVAPNVVGGLGYLTGSETLKEAGDSMERSLQRAFPVNPLYAEEFSQKAANVLGQAGSTLATGGVGGTVGKALGGASAIGKGAQAGALVPAFLAGTRGGGQEAERYGMTGGSAYARALLGGGIELASEKLLFGLGTETAAARRLLGESLDAGKGAFLKAAGTEAGEEAAAQIGGNLATMGLAPEGVETPGAFEDTLESAALGAVGGSVFGGINALTGKPRTPVLDAEGNQVTVEGQPVFQEDLEESVAPLTVADVEGDPVLEPVIQAASDTVAENADVLPITNQVLQEINATPETEIIPGEPVPEIEAEAPAQEALVTEPTNETAQVEIQETGGPVAVEQLASEAIPEGQAQEGVEVGESEGAEVVAETPVAETPVAETPVAETPVAETPVAETPVAPQQRTPSRAATPTPQVGQQVQFRREGKSMSGTYRGRDRLGRHIVESDGQEEFVASTPAVIENTPIQGVTTPETFPDKGVQLSAASMRSRGRRGLTVQETETIATNFSKALRKGPPVRVVTAAQIGSDPEFAEVRDAVSGVGGKITQVEGWFDRSTNTVFLVADQVANARRARQVLIHEIIGHGGVMSVATPAEMRRIADIIRRVAPRIVSNVETYYRDASEAEKVREILARFSEDYTSADPANLPQGWERAWEEIKQITRAIIKKMGGDPNAFDDLDLHRFYTNAVRAVYEEGLSQQQVGGATLTGPELFSLRAYHGTPHKVDRFSTDKIGTGEGAQAYGWGLYFAEDESTANYYQEALTANTLYFQGEPLVVNGVMKGTLGDPELDGWFYHGSETLDPEEAAQSAEEDGRPDIAKKIRDLIPEIIKAPPGNLYTVNLLPDQDAFLDWNRPMRDQSDRVRAILGPEAESLETPEDFYNRLAQDGGPQKASEYLASIGIPGIRYLDAKSRDGNGGTHNFVIFDDSLVSILEENGVPRESSVMMSLNYPGTEEVKEEIRRQEEAGVVNARETRARFAPFDKENLRYIPTTEEGFKADAEAFMDSLPLEEAAQRVLDGQVPENLRAGEDGRQHVLVAEAIRRLTVAIDSGADPYEQARYLALANQLALKFAREGTADGRALKSRATANTLLAPIAPVLAAQKIMRERITSTLDSRFDGGTEGVTDKVRKVSEDSAAQASEDVAAELEDEAEAQDEEILSEAEELREQSERQAEQIIASLVKPNPESQTQVNRVRQVYKEHMRSPMTEEAFVGRLTALGVSPETSTSLFNVAQDELRGRELTRKIREKQKAEEQAVEAQKSAERIIQSLVRPANEKRKKEDPVRSLYEQHMEEPLSYFVFQLRMGQLGVEATTAESLYRIAEQELRGRELAQQLKEEAVLDRRIALANSRASQLIYRTEERLRQGSKDLKTNPDGDSINKAFRDQIKSPVSLEAFTARLKALDVTSEVAERMFRTAEREAADIEAQNRFVEARKRVEDARKQASQLIYRTEERLRQGSKRLETKSRDTITKAFRDQVTTPTDLQTFIKRLDTLSVPQEVADRLYRTAAREAADRAAMAEVRERIKQRKKTDAILAKDSPKLVELLNKLRKKMFPGTNWRTIFEDLPDQQLARQKAIYDRLRKDERLRNLTTEEGVALTNELDKAWQRQRRKVFLEDLRRQGVLGEKDATDRQKVEKAFPKILRALNLGTFNSELMREAMAAEYGIRTITAQEAKELRKLAQEAYKQPEGILRDRKVAEVMDKLQNATGSSISELVNNYWVASVLSGTATMFDTYMSAVNGLGNNLLQAGTLFARGQRGDALAAVSQWFEGLRQGARESMLILAKGDYSVLKRFGTDLNKAMEGDPNFRPVPLGESLWRNGNAFQKYGMAPVMMWTGRLMSAADHINNTATSYGAMAVARALHPEFYEGKGAFTKQEKDAAREQAVREVTGGTEPQSLEDKATVSKRTREILAGLLRPEQREEAAFIGDQAAYQNDPLGLFGAIYQGISAGIGTIERRAEALSTDPDVQAKFTRAILAVLAGGLRGLTGTKFMRFGFNFGNDITQYIPGTYLLQKLAPVYGTKMSRSQQDLLLGKNIFGLVTAIGVAALFLDKDDDEEGWHMEGNWSGLNNDFKNQLRSQGKEPNTFWRRRPDGSIQRISYRSWPTSGIMVAVGRMVDQKRYQPAKWKEYGVAGNLLSAVGNGAIQVKDTTALSGLSELLGASSYSTDPEKSALERLAKTAFKFEGGFFPTLLKDIDSWEDPNNYRPETLLGEMVRHVPLARRAATEGRPMLNLLGEPVEMSRVPWRRVYTESKEGPEYTVLGQLLSRGLSLPEPSSKRTVKVDGQTTTIEQMGPRAEWEFARILGEKYRTFLLREGPALERLDNDRAEKRIRKRAQDLGDQAEAEMVRLLKPKP